MYYFKNFSSFSLYNLFIFQNAKHTQKYIEENLFVNHIFFILVVKPSIY